MPVYLAVIMMPKKWYIKTYCMYMSCMNTRMHTCMHTHKIYCQHGFNSSESQMDFFSMNQIPTFVEK